MLLRSGRLTNECTVRKRNSESRMANEPNHGEIPPPNTTRTVVTTAVEGNIPTSVGSMPALTTNQTGPLLSYVGPRGPLGTAHGGPFGPEIQNCRNATKLCRSLLCVIWEVHAKIHREIIPLRRDRKSVV